MGNLRLWSIRHDSSLVPAVRQVVRRTTGVAERLRRRLATMRDVQLAFLFGSYASGGDALGSDIDLFIVGAVDWSTLSKELESLSGDLGREVNPIVWSANELPHPTPRKARFLRDVLRKDKIWLVGDDRELERIRTSMGDHVVRGPARSACPAERRGRTGRACGWPN